MTAVDAGVAPSDGSAERKLRRDAELNRQRILVAAAEVFTERGLDATLDEVARAAGVGVGTVYRRFPDKESLVEQLFKDRIDDLADAAELACAAPDPWAGLVSFFEFSVARMAGDTGLRQLLMFATFGKEKVCYARDRMRPVLARLVERAQASGDLRDDFEATDMKLIGFMLASVAEYAGGVRPDIWRRYLAFIIDGLRPARDGVSELPAAALLPEELACVMMTSRQRPPRAAEGPRPPKAPRRLNPRR
jgi:AcrR family transcriptional regulator